MGLCHVCLKWNKVDPLALVVEKYQVEVRPKLVQGDDSGHLFLTDYGEPFVKNRMTDLVKKYLDAAGIDKVGVCKYSGPVWRPTCSRTGPTSATSR